MAVNDLDRLCEVNLRIHGTISASKLYLTVETNKKIFCSQLSKLRLTLTR